jgi:hypothetical protein
MEYNGRKCEVPGCDHPKVDSQGNLATCMNYGVHAICWSCQTKATAYYIEKMGSGGEERPPWVEAAISQTGVSIQLPRP